MKTQLEPTDIQAIGDYVLERPKPFLTGNGKQEVGDVVFDKKGLSDYLRLSESTINKMVSNKQLPHVKIQQGQSGGVRFFKRDIDKWIGKQTIPEINPFKGRR